MTNNAATIRFILLFIIAFMIHSSFAADRFVGTTQNGTYNALWMQANDDLHPCEKKTIFSETKNGILNSVSSKQEQNFDNVLSGYNNDSVIKPTNMDETPDLIQTDDDLFDNQTVNTQLPVTNEEIITKKLINLGMWNWETRTWDTSPEQFINQIRAKGINQIYLQLAIENENIKYKEQLNQLLDIAYENQIKIIAVEGSPDMVIDSGLRNAIERNKIIKQFCSMREDKPCLAGIQYDIEPYVLDDYNQDPDYIWKLWHNAIKMLSQSWGDKIEIVIPFWLLYIDNGEQIVQSIQSYISRYTIMAYRTDYTQIYNISAKWLIWGDENEQKIMIALENSLLDDGVENFYIPILTSDELEKAEFNDKEFILLNKDKLHIDSNTYTYSSPLSPRAGSRDISFMGDEDKLFQTVDLLGNDLTQWNSFDGIALHGLAL
ncbi:hypothetical protein J3U21_10395 [Gilliamella sp. B2776]|uniref:hypothetical protein n=1 Tax=unclassified Gilliamella TaxID=2685620 RepID=UPI00226A1E38|nr:MULTISPECIES: hypothetical protein [unclassified Gilliamella]MCX8650714.1 hypothetical protein [Gilliamella sp. B2779]MCX8654331.1 hypothetical protein [Gilliamella sp. B2737]MCX8665812.1 hypothetical protein [Gilliamella sp. B2887]MCX8692562.1 hypothetical protein [Gilliamella sp. B2776]MCX8698103.1 hypothetical protein [Gilliamella sp. B3000]